MSIPRKWGRSTVLSLLLFHFTLLVAGVQQNRTIDDTNGDPGMGIMPIYNGIWNQNSQCNGCLIHPDASKALQGTWHETTWLSTSGPQPFTVQFTFTGVALSVYCILPPKNISALTTYALTFTLDGKPLNDKNFSRSTGQLTNDYQYNVSVLDLSNLENKNHTFIMATSTTTPNLVEFDYASYIYDSEGIISDSPSSSSSSKSHSNLAPILGGVLGSLLFLAACGLLVIFVRRRRAAILRDHEGAITQPFDSPNVPSASSGQSWNAHGEPTIYSQTSHPFSPTDIDSRSIPLSTMDSSSRTPSHAHNLTMTSDSMSQWGGQSRTEQGYINEKGPPPAYEQ